MNRQKIITSMILSCVLAGASLSIANAQVSRPFAGTSRYDTALKIISNGWTKSQSVVLASANDANLVDALAAAPLAKKLNAPIVLTNGTSLDSAAISKLKSLGVKNVYITSGTGVIKSSIETQLKSIGVTNIYRLGGQNRYDTSVNIAKAVGACKEIMIARGDQYADALSAASIAANQGIPILLSDKDSLPQSVSAYIKSNNVSNSYVLGLQGAISDNVASKLPNPKRLGGQNRFETNIAIIKGFEDLINFDKVYVAAGDGKPVDALAGSPLAAMYSAPIILTTSVLPNASAEYLKTVLSTDSDIEIFGGTGAVSKAVSDKLDDIQKNLNTSTGSSTASIKTVITSVLKTIDIINAPSANCIKYRISGNSSEISVGTPVTIVAPTDTVKIYFYSSNDDVIAVGTMNIKSDSDSYKFNVRFVK